MLLDCRNRNTSERRTALDNNVNNTNEKLTDKAFSRLMLTSILGILVCIVCLCSCTWAWYNTNVSASENKLGSGVFALDVTVTDSSATPIETYDQINGDTLCLISAPGTYTVTLEMTENSTVEKGFCVITVAGVSYSTATIKKIAESPFTFTIDATSAISITFSDAWGSPANPTIRNGDVFTVGTPITTE